MADPLDHRTTSTYDAEGQVTRIEDAVNSVTTITYNHDAVNQFAGAVDLADNLSSVGRTTYSYDSSHRLTTMTRSIGGTAGPRVAMGYDAGNRMTSIERTINGADPKVLTTLSYDAANRVTTITHAKATYNFFPPGYVTTPLATYTYGYDDANRVTSETNAEGSVTYAYDSTNQLTTVTGARSESNSYDLNGNRTMTGYTTGAGNQLAAGAGFTFTYDGEGNMTGRTETATGKVTTFAYDHRNRMTGATTKDSGGSVIMLATYTYDALGRRIGTNVDADGAGAGAAVQTWMVYDGVNTYADFDGGGSLAMRYLSGLQVDQLLARTSAAGTTMWYLTDRLGTVRDIADVSGSVAGHRAYDSFGGILSASGSGNDRFSFTGREYDQGIGSYYYRARYYNANTGRFQSQDPIAFKAGDANLYRYVGNSPTNLVDPSGLDWQGASQGAQAGFLIGGTWFGGAALITGPAAPITVPTATAIGAVAGSVIFGIWGYFAMNRPMTSAEMAFVGTVAAAPLAGGPAAAEAMHAAYLRAIAKLSADMASQVRAAEIAMSLTQQQMGTRQAALQINLMNLSQSQAVQVMTNMYRYSGRDISGTQIHKDMIILLSRRLGPNQPIAAVNQAGQVIFGNAKLYWDPIKQVIAAVDIVF